MPGGSGGGGSQQVVSNNAPWKGAQPYILGDATKGIPGVMPEAQRLYQAPSPNYYPGDTFADFSPAQRQGMQLTADRALGGSPYNAAAGGELMKTLSGDYLTPGTSPYMDNVFADVQQRIMPGIQAQYTAAGRSPGGSGLFADTAASAMTRAFAPIAMNDAAQNYARERGFMQNAMQFAPTLAGQDYVDLGQLLGVGGMQQQQAQGEIGADVNRYNFYQNLPQQKLNNYLQAIYGVPGSSSYSSQSGGGGGGVDPYQLAGLGIAAAGMFI